MNIKLLNISNKKNGTMTSVIINKKSIENKTLFVENMHKYLCNCGYNKCNCKYGYFIWQPDSSINFKYVSRASVASTEKYLIIMKKEYFKKLAEAEKELSNPSNLKKKI